MALGSAVLGDAYVNIMGETSQLQASFAKAQMMTKGLVSNIGKTIAIGIGASIAGIGGFLVYGLKQWMGKEVAIQDMAAALRLSGDTAKESAEDLVEFSNAMQRVTTIGNEEVLMLMKQGLAFGMGSSKIKEFTKAAIGLGERLGMGPRTGMMLLNRAVQGQMQMFTRYGLQIDKTKSKAEQLKEVMKFASEGFVLAEQKANTITGRLKQLRNAFGDFAAEFGKRIANQMGLKYFAEEAARVIDRVGSALGSLFGKERGKNEFADQLKTFGSVLETVLVKFTAFILTLPTVFKMLYDLFSKPGKFLELIVQAGKDFASFLWESIKNIGAFLLDIFRGLGPVLASAVESALLNVPILNKSVADKYIRDMYTTRREVAGGVEYVTDESAVRKAKADFERDMFSGGGAVGARVKSMMQANAAESIGDLTMGTIKAGDALVAGMNASLANLSEELKADLKDAGIDVDKIRGVFTGYEDAIRKAMGSSAPGKELTGKGREMGGAEKVGMETTSFAGFWSKMMKDAMAPKTDEEIAKATQTTADNTGKIYSELGRLNAGVFA